MEICFPRPPNSESQLLYLILSNKSSTENEPKLLKGKSDTCVCSSSSLDPNKYLHSYCEVITIAHSINTQFEPFVQKSDKSVKSTRHPQSQSAVAPATIAFLAMEHRHHHHHRKYEDTQQLESQVIARKRLHRHHELSQEPVAEKERISSKEEKHHRHHQEDARRHHHQEEDRKYRHEEDRRVNSEGRRYVPEEHRRYHPEEDRRFHPEEDRRFHPEEDRKIYPEEDRRYHLEENRRYHLGEDSKLEEETRRYHQDDKRRHRHHRRDSTLKSPDPNNRQSGSNMRNFMALANDDLKRFLAGKTPGIYYMNPQQLTKENLMKEKENQNAEAFKRMVQSGVAIKDYSKVMGQDKNENTSGNTPEEVVEVPKRRRRSKKRKRRHRDQRHVPEISHIGDDAATMHPPNDQELDSSDFRQNYERILRLLPRNVAVAHSTKTIYNNDNFNADNDSLKPTRIAIKTADADGGANDFVIHDQVLDCYAMYNTAVARPGYSLEKSTNVRERGRLGGDLREPKRRLLSPEEDHRRRKHQEKVIARGTDALSPKGYKEAVDKPRGNPSAYSRPFSLRSSIGDKITSIKNALFKCEDGSVKENKVFIRTVPKSKSTSSLETSSRQNREYFNRYVDRDKHRYFRLHENPVKIRCTMERRSKSPKKETNRMPESLPPDLTQVYAGGLSINSANKEKKRPKPVDSLEEKLQQLNKEIIKLRSPTVHKSRSRCKHVKGANDSTQRHRIKYCTIGTSTTLDNNFSDILQLLSGPRRSTQTKSPFRMKKAASKDKIIETATKSANYSKNSANLVVKGIEPAKKLGVNTNTPPRKMKFEKLSYKVISIVSIPPAGKEKHELAKIPEKIEPASEATPPQEILQKKVDRLKKYYNTESNYCHYIHDCSRQVAATKLEAFVEVSDRSKSDSSSAGDGYFRNQIRGSSPKARDFGLSRQRKDAESQVEINCMEFASLSTSSASTVIRRPVGFKTNGVGVGGDHPVKEILECSKFATVNTIEISLQGVNEAQSTKSKIAEQRSKYDAQNLNNIDEGKEDDDDEFNRSPETPQSTRETSATTKSKVDFARNKSTSKLTTYALCTQQHVRRVESEIPLIRQISINSSHKDKNNTKLESPESGPFEGLRSPKCFEFDFCFEGDFETTIDEETCAIEDTEARPLEIQREFAVEEVPKGRSSKEASLKEGSPKERSLKERSPKERSPKETCAMEETETRQLDIQGEFDVEEVQKGRSEKERSPKEGSPNERSPKERSPKERSPKEANLKESSPKERSPKENSREHGWTAKEVDIKQDLDEPQDGDDMIEIRTVKTSFPRGAVGLLPRQKTPEPTLVPSRSGRCTKLVPSRRCTTSLLEGPLIDVSGVGDCALIPRSGGVKENESLEARTPQIRRVTNDDFEEVNFDILIHLNESQDVEIEGSVELTEEVNEAILEPNFDRIDGEGAQMEEKLIPDEPNLEERIDQEMKPKKIKDEKKKIKQSGEKDHQKRPNVEPKPQSRLPVKTRRQSQIPKPAPDTLPFHSKVYRSRTKFEARKIPSEIVQCSNVRLFSNVQNCQELDTPRFTEDLPSGETPKMSLQPRQCLPEQNQQNDASDLSTEDLVFNNSKSDTLILNDKKPGWKHSDAPVNNWRPPSRIPKLRNELLPVQSKIRSHSAGGSKNSTLFLTKTDNAGSDISSFQKRKMYDMLVRKNLKKKVKPQQVFEVRYFEVINEPPPALEDAHERSAIWPKIRFEFVGKNGGSRDTFCIVPDAGTPSVASEIDDKILPMDEPKDLSSILQTSEESSPRPRKRPKCKKSVNVLHTRKRKPIRTKSALSKSIQRFYDLEMTNSCQTKTSRKDRADDAQFIESLLKILKKDSLLATKSSESSSACTLRPKEETTRITEDSECSKDICTLFRKDYAECSTDASQFCTKSKMSRTNLQTPEVDVVCRHIDEFSICETNISRTSPPNIECFSSLSASVKTTDVKESHLVTKTLSTDGSVHETSKSMESGYISVNTKTSGGTSGKKRVLTDLLKVGNIFDRQNSSSSADQKKDSTSDNTSSKDDDTDVSQASKPMDNFEEMSLEVLLARQNHSSEKSCLSLPPARDVASERISPRAESKTNMIKSDALLTECLNSLQNEQRDFLLSIFGKKKDPVRGSNHRHVNTETERKQSTELIVDYYPEDEKVVMDDVSKPAVLETYRSHHMDMLSEEVIPEEGDEPSEEGFFESLLALYEKEFTYLDRLIRDDIYFTSLVEEIRTSELEPAEDPCGHQHRKSKAKNIFRRLFRLRRKKDKDSDTQSNASSTSTFFNQTFLNQNFEQSSNTLTTDSAEGDIGDKKPSITDLLKQSKSEILCTMASRTKRRFQPLVQAAVRNKRIKDEIKLAGFLKLLQNIKDGDFSLIERADENLERKLKEQVKYLFVKVYKVADKEMRSQQKILQNEKIYLLRVLVTKYGTGFPNHIYMLATYIGRGLIQNRRQLEDAIIYLLRVQSPDVNIDKFEKYCGIHIT